MGKGGGGGVNRSGGGSGLGASPSTTGILSGSRTAGLPKQCILTFIKYTQITPMLIVIGLILVGCDYDTRLSRLEKASREKKTSVDSLKRALSNLQSDIIAIKSDIMEIRLDNLLRNFGKVVYLTPGDEGYSMIITDIGTLTVQISNISEYANGCRIVLKIGNLTSATIDGLKLTIEWGSVNNDGTPVNKTSKSKEITLSKSLRAGAWNSVNVVLDAFPPSTLGFVRIKDVSHTGISLQKD